MTEKIESTYEVLLNLVASGKASVSQQKDFASLLQKQAIQQEQDEKEEKFQQLREYAKSIDLSEELILQAFQQKPILMFECEINGNKYQRFLGTLGKCSFAELLKKTFTEQQALKFVIQSPDSVKAKGEKFVKNVYKP